MDVQSEPTAQQITPETKKIPLMECFGPTIQGEGAVIGLQTYFLRFGLCDYKCTMCDSMHAVDPQSVKAYGKWLTQAEIRYELEKKYKAHSTKWVTFSGGNPAIHDLSHLTRSLQNFGWSVAVETQGSYWNPWLRLADIVTVSPKGPGMGERLDLDTLDAFMDEMRGHRGMNIKVVIFDQRDLEVAAMLWERYWHHLPKPEQFYLSLGNPNPPGPFEPPNYYDMRNGLIERYKSLLQDVQVHPVLSKVKFLPQWHVIVWGNAKGV